MEVQVLLPTPWGISSVGRAPALQAGCQRFESAILHPNYFGVMQLPFYDDWFQSRLNKTRNILGDDWFLGKTILELGAAHGDFGMFFTKLGSQVTFCDARFEHLESIQQKLQVASKLIQLDQNTVYDLGQQFDLVLHFGVLYHVENWRQDLACALNHSNLMLLETVVHPDNTVEDYWEPGGGYHYDEYNCLHPTFTEASVEKTLTELGAKFIRFDNADLNTTGWLHDNVIIQNVYNWTSDNYLLYQPTVKNDIEYRTHYRRFWLVIR